MSTLSSFICVILLFISIFKVDGKQHLDKNGENSRMEWIITGVCLLKFPDYKEQLHNCIANPQLPFKPEPPLGCFHPTPEELHTDIMRQTGEILSFLDLVPHVELSDTYRWEVEFYEVPVINQLLKKHTDGRYYFVNGGMPQVIQGHNRDSVTLRCFFIERGDYLLIYMDDEVLMPEAKVDINFRRVSRKGHTYSVRIVINQF